MSNEAKAIRDQHAGACKYLMVPAVRYFELMKMTATIRDLNQSDIPAILLNTSTEKKYQQFKNSLIELWRLNKKQKDNSSGLDAKSRHAARQSEMIRFLIGNKKSLTGAEIRRVFKVAAGTPGDLATARKRIKELYSMTYDKKNKLYLIGEKRSLASVIDQAKSSGMLRQHFSAAGAGNLLNNSNLQKKTGTKKLII